MNTADDTNVCSDGEPCTDDFCYEGECVSVSKNFDDGDVCNGLETCDPATGNSVPGTPLDCDDSDACTIDTCDSVLGCQHEDIICDDINLCTTDECVDGLCVYTPVDCDDGDPCTADSCDPATGDCINTPINCYCPVAEDDEFGLIYTSSCSPLVVSITDGVLMNDIDDDGDELTAELLSGPSHGTLTLNPDGSFTYKAVLGFIGTDSFTYRAFDGECYSETATVTIHVAKCPWTVRNELYSASCGTEKVVPASEGVLANDPVAIAVVNPQQITIDPKYGTIEVHEDGSFVYDPTGATGLYTGLYIQFKYTATNGVCEAKYQGTAKIQVRCS